MADARVFCAYCGVRIAPSGQGWMSPDGLVCTAPGGHEPDGAA